MSDKGVNIDLPDKHGYTPFRRALFNGEWNTTQYLLDHDALVDSMDTGNSKKLDRFVNDSYILKKYRYRMIV